MCREAQAERKALAAGVAAKKAGTRHGSEVYVLDDDDDEEEDGEEGEEGVAKEVCVCVCA